MSPLPLAVDLVAIALGLLAIRRALVDAFNVVLLPRSTRARSAYVRKFFRWSWRAWSNACARIPSARHRDDVLAVYGPFSMVALFASWIVLLVVGFGLLHWAAGSTHSLGASVLLSADMFFTVGSAAAALSSGLTHGLGVVEAGIGFAFIALTIGYLPVLYGQFSAREAYILRFQVRAAPGWSAADVVTFYAGADPALLDRWLREAEFWIADLMVSHNSYPMLAFYRSQRENPSWLASIARDPRHVLAAPRNRRGPPPGRCHLRRGAVLPGRHRRLARDRQPRLRGARPRPALRRRRPGAPARSRQPPGPTARCWPPPSSAAAPSSSPSSAASPATSRFPCPRSSPGRWAAPPRATPRRRPTTTPPGPARRGEAIPPVLAGGRSGAIDGGRLTPRPRSTSYAVTSAPDRSRRFNRPGV